MPFDDVYLVSERLEVATDTDVTNAETFLNITFPPGYREYITTLGDGVYAGYVHFYMPPQIVDLVEPRRSHWEANYHWAAGGRVLGQGRLQESFIIGVTLDGDDLVMHPHSQLLYMLPSFSDHIYEIGTDIFKALDWLYRHGIPENQHPLRYFDSEINRGRLLFRASGSRLAFEELRDYLLTLNIHDHVISDSTEGFIQLFVKEFYGYVSVFTFLDRKIRVDVEYDIFRKSEAMRDLVAYLNAAGFQMYH